MQHPASCFLFAALSCATLVPLATPLVAQRGYHVDARVGFKLRVPQRWKAWPVEKDRRFVTGHYVQIQGLPIEGIKRTHRPVLRVVVLPDRAARKSNGRGPAESASKSGSKPAAKVQSTTRPAVEFYEDYADYLARNLSGTLTYQSGSSGEISGVPFEQYRIRRRVNDLNYALTTWVVKLDHHAVAIEFMVLDKYEARLKARLLACFRSFRRIPVDATLAQDDPWAPPWWVRDPKRWRELPGAERLAQRAEYESVFVARVRKDLKPGFRFRESKRFLILSNADSRFTTEISKAADSCLDWCEEHLDGISEDPVIKAVIRVFGSSADYDMYRARSRQRSHYVPAIREIVIAPGRRRPTEDLGLEDLTQAVLHLFLTDKDVPLYRNLPAWLRSGLTGYLRLSKLARGKMQLVGSDYEREVIRDAMRGKRLETVKNLITERTREREGRNRRLRYQRVRLSRFLFEPGRRARNAFPPGFLTDYIAAVVVAHREFGVPPGRSGAGATPGMNEAIAKQRGEEHEKIRRDLLDAVNKIVCPWSDAQWAVLQKTYVKFNQKQ